MYKYVFDNNEQYPEDYDEYCLFSTEQITPKEFESIVKDAFQSLEARNEFPNYSNVAREILKTDERFFLPEFQSVVYIGSTRTDSNRKIRGFSHRD